MTRDRRKDIINLVSEIQDVHTEFSIKDCFFVLYDDKTITGAELDYLMDIISKDVHVEDILLLIKWHSRQYITHGITK